MDLVIGDVAQGSGIQHQGGDGISTLGLRPHSACVCQHYVTANLCPHSPRDPKKMHNFSRVFHLLGCFPGARISYVCRETTDFGSALATLIFFHFSGTSAHSGCQFTVVTSQNPLTGHRSTFLLHTSLPHKPLTGGI